MTDTEEKDGRIRAALIDETMVPWEDVKKYNIPRRGSDRPNKPI